ncbi:Na/Pi cotransporter family protein [Arsenicicoccus sp. MKL-02]|uniref:Na/Pi cotransporter family protein n=1 Tax=Arsenicicoccus cauae TaxID=2663847 RepID=A0A6I3IAE1_9MICO|nr:Na/Pi symporter [Arsenicicoccus cauae]MTB70862.1 Na/Pi cotransporter family protein [Arsenicicoccus cauae]
MDVDIFKDILVPVIGGLGIFLLGLEFMDNGIQALSVNKMRKWLATMAGTPAKGVVAGTIITGIIQSSTAMTVMTVGLVNAGVLSLRSAIGVIMGANIGTTLGNGLIALPLGPIGLLSAGIFACVYCFSKVDKVRNIALAAMGFSLIFYGLNLMTGGLKPLRKMPAVMDVLSSLDSTTFIGVVSCALIAALITAMIHSSSATIGIVMGLGASGVLEWQTAIAFAIGADLGTTITSWIASLNLSKNAKRTAYAHIAFNFIGVCVVLALFFPAIQVLKWAMGFFGGDPGAAVVVDGQETYPLVPVAVGMFSIFFNIFNVLILFPFVSTFERVLSRIGHTDAEDAEDYAEPKYLDRSLLGDFPRAVGAVRAESGRVLEAGALFIAMARGEKQAPKDTAEHWEATDSLSREIRAYSAELFTDDLDRTQMDLVGSLIEEVDFTTSLADSLHQIARRVERDDFSPAGKAYIAEGLERVDVALDHVIDRPETAARETAPSSFEDLRWRVIDTASLPAGEKGALLALLGSIERAEALVARIAAERASVDPGVAGGAVAEQPSGSSPSA